MVPGTQFRNWSGNTELGARYLFVRVPVTAVRTGGYTINFTLVGEDGD